MQDMDEKLNIENETSLSAKENQMQGSAKVKSWAKGKLNRKTLVSTILILVALICAFVGVRYATNNYMTPIRSTEKQENQESVNIKKYVKNAFKDIGARNADTIIKLLCKSDDFLDFVDEAEENFEENFEWKLDKYGDDFKITYTIEDKIKLGKSDLRDYQKEFRQYVKFIENSVEETEDFTADDWDDLAEEVGMTRTQTKQFVRALKDMVDDIGRLEVTDGYEIDILKTVTGSMLDEPEEDSVTFCVVKVNGRWIFVDSFEEIFYAHLYT